MEIADYAKLKSFIAGKRWFNAKDARGKFGRGFAPVMIGLGWSYLNSDDGQIVWFNPSLITPEDVDHEFRLHQELASQSQPATQE